MAANFLLVLLQRLWAAKQSAVQEQPRLKACIRPTPLVFENPLEMLAFYAASSEFGSPVSELAANGRLLHVIQGRKRTRSGAA
jgi:hypothetical protein